jgi:hypothetical protein
MTSELASELRRVWKQTIYRDDDDLVFAHPDHGGVLPKANISRRFCAALRAAGLEDHRFHDLRHTFGTRMAAAGVPLRTLQEWMGHRDITTTQRYADYAPSEHEGEMGGGGVRAADGDSCPHRRKLRYKQHAKLLLKRQSTRQGWRSKQGSNVVEIGIALLAAVVVHVVSVVVRLLWQRLAGRR